MGFPLANVLFRPMFRFLGSLVHPMYTFKALQFGN